MTRLDTAAQIYAGPVPVAAAYMGSAQVWPATEPTPDFPEVVDTRIVTTGGGACAVTVPDSARAGDLLLLLIGRSGGASGSQTAPAGFTTIYGQSFSVYNSSYAHAKAVLAGDVGQSINWYNAEAGVGILLIVRGWSGVISDVTASAQWSSSSGSTVSYNTHTPTTGLRKYLWLAWMTVTSDVTSHPAGWSAVRARSGPTCQAAWLEAEAATLTPPSHTHTASANARATRTLAIPA